jgi:hypothetical protein
MSSKVCAHHGNTPTWLNGLSQCWECKRTIKFSVVPNDSIYARYPSGDITLGWLDHLTIVEWP